MLSWRWNCSKSHPKSIILPLRRATQSSWRISTLLQCIHITTRPSWLYRLRTPRRKTTTYQWRHPQVALSKPTRWWQLINSPLKSDSCSLPNSHSLSLWVGTRSSSSSRLLQPPMSQPSSHAPAVSNCSINIRASRIRRFSAAAAATAAAIPSTTSHSAFSSQAWTCQCQIDAQTTRSANRLRLAASTRGRHRSQTPITTNHSLPRAAARPAPSSRSTWIDCSMAKTVERLSWFGTFPTSTLKKCSWSVSTGCTKADMTFSTCHWTWTMGATLDMHSLTSWTLSTLFPSLKTWTTSRGSPSTRRRSVRSPLEESKASATCWIMWASSRIRARSSP